MKATLFAELLKDYLLPFSCCVHDNSLLFMKDNTAVQKAHIVKEWFKDSGTAILQCPV